MSPTGFAILIGFAILFYRAAEAEHRSGIIWAGISAFAFAASIYFRFGLIGMLAGQLLTYLLLWLVNYLRPKIHLT